MYKTYTINTIYVIFHFKVVKLYSDKKEIL